MPLITSIFFGFAPVFLFACILYWLDRYEKEPLLLLGGVFIWGAVVAAGAAYIVNTVLGVGVYIVTGSEGVRDLTTGSIIAPIVEESLKGLAVLLVFLIFRNEFDSIFDGTIYAGVAALGFAATENSFYIYSHGFQESGWSGLFALVFIRVVLVGWQHPFYTSFTGIGLALSRLNRSWGVKIIAPLLGWLMAVFTHSFHNTLASLLSGVGGLAFGTMIDWSGWFVMFLFMLWVLGREKKRIETYLRDEITSGTMTTAQYRAASSGWKRFLATSAALFSGQFQATRRFYQLCGELAHKKYQKESLGEESNNSAIILRLREEMARLSPVARV